MNKNQLDEIFTLPLNTYEVANLSGQKLYSSNGLKKNYVKDRKSVV